MINDYLRKETGKKYHTKEIQKRNGTSRIYVCLNRYRRNRTSYWIEEIDLLPFLSLSTVDSNGFDDELLLLLCK